MEISADKLSNESRKKLFQSPLPQNGISGFVAWSTGTVPLCSDRGASSSAAASSSEPCGACRGIDATTIVLDCCFWPDLLPAEARVCLIAVSLFTRGSDSKSLAETAWSMRGAS